MHHRARYAGRSIFLRTATSAPTSPRRRVRPSARFGRHQRPHVNNVNAAPQLIDSDHLHQLARIADTLRPWGVVSPCPHHRQPADHWRPRHVRPLDPAVKAWWPQGQRLYTLIPDFAGSPSRPTRRSARPRQLWPHPADAANTLAAASRPTAAWCFIAPRLQPPLDWRNPKATAPRRLRHLPPSTANSFPTSFVQTKEGPIDFQAREPVSPLFAGLEHTSQAMEVQIHQEVHRPAAPSRLLAPCGSRSSTPTSAPAHEPTQ